MPGKDRVRDPGGGGIFNCSFRHGWDRRVDTTGTVVRDHTERVGDALFMREGCAGATRDSWPPKDIFRCGDGRLPAVSSAAATAASASSAAASAKASPRTPSIAIA